MDKSYHSVRLDESLCKGCINCIKRCPTEAIRVRGGKASINNKFCINCGKCIRVCSHHAKLVTYNKLDVMKKYRYTVALPAPSLYNQLNNLDDTNIMLNALLLMGFGDVFEVNVVAELVSEAIRQYISEHREQLPLINAARPSVVHLIWVHFPDLILHLLPINPPVEVAAVLAVEKAMEDTGLPREEIGIMFTSPYLSKVTYVRSPLGTEKSEIDWVLAIKDAYPKLLACMKIVMREDYPVVDTSGKIGISWGHSGEEASGPFAENYLATDGIENVIRVLENMEDQKFTNLRSVELSACNGGCVGGALTVENPYVAEVKLERLREYMPAARSHMHGSEENVIKWTIGVQYEPVFRLGNNMMESSSRPNQVERLMEKSPGLDYGSCGVPTCKALAEGIVRGDADETDCVYYLRENLHKLSGEVAVLADDLHNGDRGGQETLCVLKEYVQRISSEMSMLDKKDEDEDRKRRRPEFRK